MYTMDHFEEVTLEFDGKTYTVAEDRIWGLLKAIENVTTFHGLVNKLALNEVPAMTVYEAYAVALRYAGHKSITPQDVAKGVNRQQMMAMAYALVGILRMSNPPEDLDISGVEGSGSGVPSSETEDEGKKKAQSE
jgi:hypothetical protein